MDVQIPKYQPDDPINNPAAYYPSPRTEAPSPPLSSPVYEQRPQIQQYPSPGIDLSETASMHPKVTDEELEKLEDELPQEDDDLEGKPRKAPPLPLEHIYVHDANYPLSLTDFEVMETLGALLPSLSRNWNPH